MKFDLRELNMKDSWCSPLETEDGMLYGGAARNVRIAAADGMDAIIENAARSAARDALKHASERASAPKKNVVGFKRKAG